MFSLSVRQGNKLGFWNTSPVCALLSATPENSTFPPLGRINPATARKRVLFPPPEGPTMQTKALRAIEKLSLSSTSRVPSLSMKVTSRLLTCKAISLGEGITERLPDIDLVGH